LLFPGNGGEHIRVLLHPYQTSTVITGAKAFNVTLLVLIDAAFKIVGEPCIKCPSGAGYDIHPITAVHGRTPRPPQKSANKFFSR
jgi:hypothetical protein